MKTIFHQFANAYAEEKKELRLKKNCWDVMNCGRGPGTIDCCPAAKDNPLDGVHGGLNAGRTCWVVAGTLCKGEISGTFAKKMDDCMVCPFYRLVKMEEEDLKSHQELLIRLRKQ